MCPETNGTSEYLLRKYFSATPSRTLVRPANILINHRKSQSFPMNAYHRMNANEPMAINAKGRKVYEYEMVVFHSTTSSSSIASSWHVDK